MDPHTNSPALVDGSAVAGISIPPGAPNFVRPSRYMPAEGHAPGAEGAAPVAEAAPTSAQESPQAADNVLAVASASSELPPALGASQAETRQEVPTFVGSRERQRSISLAWPLFYGGKLYEAIIVARPGTKAVGDYYDALRGLPDGAKGPRFPVFFHADGSPVPETVLDALDDEDATLVFGAIEDFLPLRLKLLLEQPADASTLPSGDDTGPKSSD